MTENVVERLAHAVVVDGAPGWALRSAESSLQALRNPSETMVAAALKGQADTPEARKAIKLQWRRMIDAALKVGDQDGIRWLGLDGDQFYDACENRWPGSIKRPDERSKGWRS